MAPRIAIPALLTALLALAGGCDSAQEPTFQVAMPFSTKYVTPSDGDQVDVDVSAGLSLFAAFSAPVDPGTADGVGLLRDGVPFTGTAVELERHELRLAHEGLPPGDYVFLLPAELASTDGDVLGYEIRVRFRVTPRQD